MKKVIWFVIIVLGILAAVLFIYQGNINNIINSKITQLNNSGFVVKHEQSTNYIKTSATGEIEVIDPDKVAALFFDNIKNEELKKSFQTQYNALDLNAKEILFNGVKFDYDFVLENFTGKVNTNLYLTNFSKTVMNNLTQEINNPNNKWLLDFLKDKKLQISINEKKEYKIADIEATLPENNLNIITKDIHGNEKNISISSLKISEEKDYLLINDINMDYEIDNNKQNSKTLIKNIEFQEKDSTLNIKNLILNSSYEKDSVNINTKSEFGFDEVNAKSLDGKVTTLKNTSFVFNINNLPFNKIEEYALDLQNQKYDEYLNSLAQSGASIDSKGNASSYTINNQLIFDTLKFDLLLKLNKNISPNEIGFLTDIFENAKLTVDLDLQTAQNLKTLLNQKEGLNIDFTDTNSNLKRFEANLKNDGLYINEKKALDKSELAIPKNDDVFEDTTIKKISQKSLTYEYKKIDDNLLQLDIKYTPNLKAVTSGGISVSFPAFKDTSRVVKKTTNSFDEINVYNEGTLIWDGGTEKDINSSYLLVEAWDNNWKNSEPKDISLIIDIKDLEKLEIYVRAGSLNENSDDEIKSEIVPEDGEKDQQNYPVEIIDVPLNRLR